MPELLGKGDLKHCIGLRLAQLFGELLVGRGRISFSEMDDGQSGT